MAISHQPIIGDWYVTYGGDTFEVVAYDPDEETVEIQYFDGSVEEIDLETWLDIGAAPSDPPEDWSGSLDMAREDVGADDRASPFRPGSPLDDPSL